MSKLVWRMLTIVVLSLATAAPLIAHPPLVKMRVTLPDGQVREVTAPESSVGRLTYGATEYEFRPTIQDSRPWRHVVVTVFEAATATTTTKKLGDVELRTGEGAAKTKTTPAFEIAVVDVTSAEPAKATS